MSPGSQHLPPGRPPVGSVVKTTGSGKSVHQRWHLGLENSLPTVPYSSPRPSAPFGNPQAHPRSPSLTPDSPRSPSLTHDTPRLTPKLHPSETPRLTPNLHVSAQKPPDSPQIFISHPETPDSPQISIPHSRDPQTHPKSLSLTHDTPRLTLNLHPSPQRPQTHPKSPPLTPEAP